ncbi:MAG: hypothetical protein JJT82_10865 [Legionellaceae bacterium]|nr:hypothetical protein [Legionellaceae bacterium]
MISALSACQAHQEKWYLQHPQALQEALSACPEQTPRGISCEHLKMLDRFVKELADELQQDPQAFGQKIMQLQMKITQLEATLHRSPAPQELKAVQVQLHNLNQELEHHMLAVRLLESPGG